MQFSVEISKESMRSVKTLLNGIQKDIDKTMVMAINETLPGTKTDIVAELQKEINLPKSILLHGPTKGKQTFSIKRADIGSISGKISTTGANINLKHYRTAPRALVARKKYKKYEVQVKKSRGTHRFRHVFIPKLESDHLGFFVQKPGGGIKELYGPRIPDIFSNPGPTERVLKKVNARLDKNLTRAVDRVIAKHK